MNNLTEHHTTCLSQRIKNWMPGKRIHESASITHSRHPFVLGVAFPLAGYYFHNCRPDFIRLTFEVSA